MNAGLRIFFIVKVFKRSKENSPSSSIAFFCGTSITLPNVGIIVSILCPCAHCRTLFSTDRAKCRALHIQRYAVEIANGFIIRKSSKCTERENAQKKGTNNNTDTFFHNDTSNCIIFFNYYDNIVTILNQKVNNIYL